jgi:auxin efflux carrier family
MITGSAVYHVVEAMAPLYTAAALGFASVRWLKAFSAEQCAGINHFVAIYAVPVLIFQMVSTNNPYAMNGRLVAADTLQKAVMLIGLMAWAAWESRPSRRRGSKVSASAASPLQWVVTAFSVSALPNTIIMGVPLLGGMYGPVSKELMKQIVVMQFCVWYNVVIFIYEYMAARRAATAADGVSAKISPGSPAAETPPEKIAPSANGSAAERAHEVTVNIEIKEIVPASTAQKGVTDDSTTTALAEEGSTGEDAKAAAAKEEAAPPAPKTAPSVGHIALKAGKKVLEIPNTYASFLGLIWSLIAFKYVSFFHSSYLVLYLLVYFGYTATSRIQSLLFPFLCLKNYALISAGAESRCQRSSTTPCSPSRRQQLASACSRQVRVSPTNLDFHDCKRSNCTRSITVF